MGQYFDLINFDKKAILKLPSQSLNKLREYYNNKKIQDALITKLVDDWKGDTVVLLGDYADEAQEDTTTHKSIHLLREKYGLSECVQDWAEELVRKRGCFNNESIVEITSDEILEEYHYIYNHKLKQYINLSKYPIGEKSSSAPLLLLIALGNGYGGGDITDVCDEEMIGSWVDSVSFITVENELLTGEYIEIKPRF